jgi:hypothetical protein
MREERSKRSRGHEVDRQRGDNTPRLPSIFRSACPRGAQGNACDAELTADASLESNEFSCWSLSLECFTQLKAKITKKRTKGTMKGAI